MQLSQTSPVAVVLPGTGSDADFARRAFGGPLAACGVRTIAVEPDPRRVVEGYLDALDQAAEEHGHIVVGGVSLGAAVAVQWAARRPSRAACVLAALPAWSGSADAAPAALSARYTATQLRRDGIESVIAVMRASSPPWLGVELERSWRSQWPDLPAALEEAGAYDGLTHAVLGAVRVPVGIASAVDDAVHPAAVAHEWAAALPRAAVAETTLADVGHDPAILGSTCLRALTAVGTDVSSGPAAQC